MPKIEEPKIGIENKTKTPFDLGTEEHSGQVVVDEAQQILAEAAERDGAKLNELRERGIVEGKENGENSIEKQKDSWAKFYQENFGLEVDLSGLEIPEIQAEFDKLIVVAKGMGPETVFQKFAELGIQVEKDEEKSLDRKFPNSNRSAKESPYAILVSSSSEPSDDALRVSAKELEKKEIPTQTLTEELLNMLKNYLETGEFIDTENAVVCAGSSSVEGHVPTVRYIRGKVTIALERKDFRPVGELGARQVLAPEGVTKKAEPKKSLFDLFRKK